MTATNAAPTRQCQTRYFGPVDYAEDAVLHFPDGIPAFEQEIRFLALRQPLNEPLVFLQSLSSPGLCFAALPVRSVCRNYRLQVAPEDLAALQLDPSRQPAIGAEVLCLALLSVEEDSLPTVNLLAPVLVNLRTRCARQVIQPDCSYSHREPVTEAACW